MGKSSAPGSSCCKSQLDMLTANPVLTESHVVQRGGQQNGVGGEPSEERECFGLFGYLAYRPIAATNSSFACRALGQNRLSFLEA